jgi:hypothetical protein
VDVPAELEAGMQRPDHDQRQAKVDVGRGPGFERPAPARHRPLADTEQGQPQDQQRRDRAERIAVPAAAIMPRLNVDQQIAEQRRQ